MPGAGPPPVIIRFETRGDRDVMRAFDSIEARMARSEKAATAAATRGARERVSTAQKEAKDREKEAAKAAMAQAKAEKSATTAAKKEGREREREAQRMATYLTNLRRRSAEIAGRYAEQEANAEIRAAKRKADELTRIRKQYATRMSGAITSSASNVLGGVGMLAGGALAIGGGLSLGGAVRERMSAERAAVSLSNSAFIPGKNDRVDPKALLERARAVGIETGQNAGDLLAGLQGYVAKSADLTGGMENLGGLAKLAKGSGTDFMQLADFAGSMRVQNANLTPDAMMSMLRSVVVQGRSGAVEMKDLASVGAKITASSAMYAGSQEDNQRRLLGLGQFAIRTAGNAEEAGTAVSRLGSDALKHRNKLGMEDLFDKQGRISDPTELVARVLQKSGGNLGKIEQMGFGERSIKLFEALAPDFNKAEANKRGTGIAAVRDEIHGITEAKYSEGDVNEDFSRVMATNSEKIDVAFHKLKEVIADKAAPYIKKFADNFPKYIPELESLFNSIAKLAGYFADNPFHAIVDIILLGITKQMAGDWLRKKLTDMLGGGGGGGGVGALGTGKGGLGIRGARDVVGTLAAGAVIAELSVQTFYVGKAIIDEMFAKKDKEANDAVGADVHGYDLILAAKRAVKEGKALSPDQVKELEGEQKREHALVGSISEEKPSWLATTLSGIGVFDASNAQSKDIAARLAAAQANEKEVVELLSKIAHGGIKVTNLDQLHFWEGGNSGPAPEFAPPPHRSEPIPNRT